MSLQNSVIDLATGAAPIANATTAKPAGSFFPILVIWGLIIFAMIYFMMVRPNKKKKAKEAEMLNKMQIGDEIVTNGGIFGRIVSIKEDSVIIESSSDKSKIRVAKWAIIENKTTHD